MTDGGSGWRYLGVRVMEPPPIRQAEVWPFAPPRRYGEFLISVDDAGNDVRFTCDPDALANYFGVNPDAPHYLTPVHFRRDVLAPYYARADLYHVMDGHVRCGDLWSMAVDLDHEDRVIAYSATSDATCRNGSRTGGADTTSGPTRPSARRRSVAMSSHNSPTRRPWTFGCVPRTSAS